MQIVYGYNTQSLYTLFQNQSRLFIRYVQFFDFMLFLLSKFIFYGVKKLKGKRVFRKIEIIHVRHIVSSVAQKQNSVDFIVRALRDKNKSRANCVPIYGDLYQNLQWSLTFNLKVVTHLKSASEASYDVINMVTIIRNCPLIKAIVCVGMVIFI